MKSGWLLQLLAVSAVVGAIAAQASESQRRVELKVILANGTDVRLTELEGDTAEVEMSGTDGFHVGLIATSRKQLVTVEIIQLADGSRRRLAKITGPIGESMDVRLGAKTDPSPSLRMTPVKVEE